MEKCGDGEDLHSDGDQRRGEDGSKRMPEEWACKYDIDDFVSMRRSMLLLRMDHRCTMGIEYRQTVWEAWALIDSCKGQLLSNCWLFSELKMTRMSRPHLVLMLFFFALNPHLKEKIWSS